MSKVREAWMGGFLRCAILMNKGVILSPEELRKEAEANCPDIPLPTVRDWMAYTLKREGYDGLYCECCFCLNSYLFECADDYTEDSMCVWNCRPGVLIDGKIVERT